MPPLPSTESLLVSNLELVLNLWEIELCIYWFYQITAWVKSCLTMWFLFVCTGKIHISIKEDLIIFDMEVL